MPENLLQKWSQVTGNLAWGKQRVLLDTLNLVAYDKIKVVYGADEFNGSPCLINAVGCMVKTAGESPSMNEPAVVRLFDRINRQFFEQGVNDHSHYMSGLAAEILVRNFGPLNAPPLGDEVADLPYVEPKAGELEKAFDEALLKASENLPDSILSRRESD